MLRNIITIDRDKCVGCGKCVNACVGGALAMVDGKATLMRDDYCDGLGVCVGECPVGALKVELKEVDTPLAPDAGHSHPVAKSDSAESPSHSAIHELLRQLGLHGLNAGQGLGQGCSLEGSGEKHAGGHVCPGTRMRDLKKENPTEAASPAIAENSVEAPSALDHWPIQLHLVSPGMPRLKNANLLLAASCTAFSYGGFHEKLLRGRALLIACPKLDRTEGYVEKLAEIFKVATPKSLTIARMEVPCCSGLTRMVESALRLSGISVPVQEVILGIGAGILAGSPAGISSGA